MSDWRCWKWEEAWEKAFIRYYPEMVDRIIPVEMLPYLVDSLSKGDQVRAELFPEIHRCQIMYDGF